MATAQNGNDSEYLRHSMANEQPAKIIYLTAGAGGMYCGSCMHDNALARALAGEGWDVQLVPTYTPIRTDETNVSVDQVFFGGINVFLQQKIPLLRYVPRFLDRFLDNPRLIRRVTSRAIETDAQLLGELAYSMLCGMNGNQRKEVKRLCGWLVDQQPDLILFTNALIGGCIPEIKKRLNVPVVVTLQGDDVFLDHLGDEYRGKCISKIREMAGDVNCFISHSEFYRDFMADYLEIDRNAIRVTPLGLDTRDFGRFLEVRDNQESSGTESGTIGYLARLAPEKGLQVLVDAFIQLKQMAEHQSTRLKIAGWLGADHQAFADQQFAKLEAAGLGNDFEYLGSIGRDEKLDFLDQVDVFSVPAVFREPKGLYALEAMAAGVPVVQPRFACFPELIEASAGGLLFRPEDATDLSQQLHRLLSEPRLRQSMGRAGQEYVHQHRNAAQMAKSTSRLLKQLVADRP